MSGVNHLQVCTGIASNTRSGGRGDTLPGYRLCTHSCTTWAHLASTCSAYAAASCQWPWERRGSVSMQPAIARCSSIVCTCICSAEPMTHCGTPPWPAAQDYVMAKHRSCTRRGGLAPCKGHLQQLFRLIRLRCAAVCVVPTTASKSGAGQHPHDRSEQASAAPIGAGANVCRCFW